ncbi:hypothetical protein [Dyadobacter sandarakinus]|uniref:Uncharacterized protein n=1 Tax=Dyadobacter sandarakinus TaxID=2747268 RepID=A0ABX7I9G3_9BACT|nr:hypothetical protein [Dyadobacter sandarakinus]QRR02167.1 hypothetical protein HWI92_15265 [Dyadobacter sandarakinus]
MNRFLFMLAAAWVTVSNPAVAQRGRPVRQPFPEQGFWVAHTSSGQQGTVVRYYANSITQVSEVHYSRTLNVSRLSARRFLNRRLKAELCRSSSCPREPPLYQMDP